MEIDQRVKDELLKQPYPMLFVTVSGAHLYGFPSPDSDYDLRGVHILPPRELLGLDDGRETLEKTQMRETLEIDLVTHDAKKFFGLMLKKNGYVLEQLFSPIVLKSGPEHEELKEIARGCITRHHAHHYLGFSRTEWGLFSKESPPRVKPLLYIYRVLLTGIHLMRTGVVEANLKTLNEEFKLPYVPELIERKMTGTEKGALKDADIGFHEKEKDKLTAMLEEAMEKSSLPDVPSGKAQLNDLLLRLRGV